MLIICCLFSVNLEVQNGEMEVALIEATATRDAIKAE
jgi:hypothetical protein